jgi:hypothetical protein
MSKKTCQCHKSRKLPVESTGDFKARLSAMLGTTPVKKHKALLRPKGSQPTPSEVLGGREMFELAKPSRKVAKWLRSLGIKV